MTRSGRYAAGLSLFLFGALSAGSAEAQVQAAAGGLPLKRELPPLPASACEAAGFVYGSPPEAPEEARADAEDLGAQANEAAILGEYVRARDLLAEAVSLDPASGALSYRFARLMEDAGEESEALGEYCRFQSLGPTDIERAEVEARIDRIGASLGLTGAGSARQAFEAGLASFDDGSYEQAVRDFSRALVERPDWDLAHYNRALAYLASDRDGAGVADLEFYLDLVPDAGDRAAVQARIDALTPSIAQYSAGTALVSGLILPGAGHFYSGRPGFGALVLLGALGSAGAGVLYTKVEVECLSPPANGECPVGQVASETETRPLLVPGLAAAGVITVLGAIHAYRGARSPAFQASRGGGLETTIEGLAWRGMTPLLRVEPAAVRRGGVRTELEVRF